MRLFLKKLYKSFLIVLALVLFLMVPGSVYGEEASEHKTREIKRIVKVGYYTTPGFQEYNKKTGEYSGYSYEYMLALAQYANWDYEFIPVSFEDGIKMLESGELDLMNNVSITDDRIDTLEFSDYSSGQNYASLIAKEGDTRVAYEDFDKFNDITVGLVTSSIYSEKFIKYCKENNCMPKLSYFNSKEEAAEALSRGQIDARIITSSQNINARVIGKFAPEQYYFATTKGNKDLINELNSAMRKLSTEMPDLQDLLWDKYYGNVNESYVVLTDKEQDFVENCTEIKVACTRSWYPISYFEGDEYVGSLREIYDMISQKTGIKFTYVAYDNYYLALEALENREVDMLCEMPFDYIYASEHKANLSIPIVDINVMRVTSNNLDKNETDYKVAILKNTYMANLTKKNMGGNVTYFEYTSAKDCVDAVLNGDVDCTFINSYQAVYYQNQAKYLSLNYVLFPNLQYKLCLSTSMNADSRLSLIITKALNSISQNDINDIFTNTIEQIKINQLERFFYERPFFAVSIIVVIVVLFAVFICVLVYSRKLFKKNIELVKAKNAESEFLSKMSHDIRTPLNGIVGMTAISLDDNISKEERLDCLNKINYSSQYLMNLVNDILDVSRISSGKIHLNPKPYSTKEFERYIESIIRPLADEKKIIFDLKSIEKETFFFVDKIRYNQIFINLLSNAIKYTNMGGYIRMYTENDVFKDGILELDTIVEDNGIGMSKEFQKHMFDAFTQVNTSAAISGSGLGLTIVKQLVDAMGGTINVVSDVGKGTKFILHFKIKITDGEANKSKNKFIDYAILKDKKVLICEDHELNAQILERLLKKVGITSVIAQNGKLGYDIFNESKENEFACILMDIRMPVMDGLEATKQIRLLERKDAKTIKIIAVSANAYDDEVRKAKLSGMDDHISKPVQPQALYEKLSQYLG